MTQQRAMNSPTTKLDLSEYKPSAPVALSASQRDGLRATVKDLTIEPAPGEERVYVVTPQSMVGAVEVEGLSVVIRPKIPIGQVLSLALYALGAENRQRNLRFSFDEDASLPDLLALALTSAAQYAFSRGLLHGYRTEEDALYGVRGRIRFEEQLRRRYGRTLPVEVRYDEFTDDVLENRLIKAAVGRLASMRISLPAARRDLGWIAGTLANVTIVEFAPAHVPEPRFDRLNEHYRDVVALARLVLRHSAFQSRRGAVRAKGFLFDMNAIFQQYVARALREKLGVSERAFGEQAILSLDLGGAVNLRPDLVWKRGGQVVFVGDAKYKDLSRDYARESDLYQLLAYTTALDLKGGLLIYAKSVADQAHAGSYVVRHSGKRLEVAALDLGGTLDDVLLRVETLARQVRSLALSPKA